MQRKFYLVPPESKLAATIRETEKLQRAASQKMKALLRRFGATRLHMVDGIPVELWFNGTENKPALGGALKPKGRHSMNWVPDKKTAEGRALREEMQAIRYPDCEAVRVELGIPFWGLNLSVNAVYWATAKGAMYVSIPHHQKPTVSLDRVSDLLVEGSTAYKKLLGED